MGEATGKSTPIDLLDDEEEGGGGLMVRILPYLCDLYSVNMGLILIPSPVSKPPRETKRRRKTHLRISRKAETEMIAQKLVSKRHVRTSTMNGQRTTSSPRAKRARKPKLRRL